MYEDTLFFLLYTVCYVADGELMKNGFIHISPMKNVQYLYINVVDSISLRSLAGTPSSSFSFVSDIGQTNAQPQPLQRNALTHSWWVPS